MTHNPTYTSDGEYIYRNGERWYSVASVAKNPARFLNMAHDYAVIDAAYHKLSLSSTGANGDAPGSTCGGPVKDVRSLAPEVLTGANPSGDARLLSAVIDWPEEKGRPTPDGCGCGRCGCGQCQHEDPEPFCEHTGPMGADDSCPECDAAKSIRLSPPGFGGEA